MSKPHMDGEDNDCNFFGRFGRRKANLFVWKRQGAPHMRGLPARRTWERPSSSSWASSARSSSIRTPRTSLSLLQSSRWEVEELE
ncbi:hypothetical protein ACQJBY_063100 [Aegilops geniculata]